jgi:outer membrane murein-binding lipoprotein Lpp
MLRTQFLRLNTVRTSTWLRPVWPQSAWRSSSVSIATVVLGLGLTAGCKDQAKCNEALATARQAMQDDYLDMNAARQWRDHAGKICGAGSEIQTLDQEILAKEAAIVKAAADKAEAEKAAGEKAIEDSKALWKSWDDLEKDAKNLQALKKTYNQAKKLMLGLPIAYAEQVKTYNETQYDKRKTKLEAAAKK